MTNKGTRREGQPILIQNGKTIRPDRILFDVKEFNEDWIQELIHHHPDTLPTKEISSPLMRHLSQVQPNWNHRRPGIFRSG